jgi:hypothetical protein
MGLCLLIFAPSATFAIALEEVDPPARDKPIVPTAAMPAVMNKKMQTSARNRNCVRLQVRFVIIGTPNRAFYPKTTKIVNGFAL